MLSLFNPFRNLGMEKIHFIGTDVDHLGPLRWYEEIMTGRTQESFTKWLRADRDALKEDLEAKRTGNEIAKILGVKPPYPPEKAGKPEDFLNPVARP